jgi:hypothetical protein
MKAILPEIRFKQFPVLLKLVIYYMGFLGLIQILTLILKLFNGAGFVWFDFISGIAYFALVIGLIARYNSSRILAMLWAVIGFMNCAFVLGLVLFSRQVKFDPFEIKLFTVQIPLSDSQWLVLWSLLLVFYVCFFFVLLRPDIRAIFSAKPFQKESV